jgi:hypothetical protein
MKQKVVIYIILSAILLYLYYRKKDFTIFVAFAVVAGTTLIFRSATIGEEGFSVGGGGGGGGGGDKDCAKLGFTPIQLDKKDAEGSLGKVMNTIKKVANKHWPYDNMVGKTTDEDKEKAFATFVKELQEEIKERKNNENESKLIDFFIMSSANAYEKGNMFELLKELEKPGRLGDIINGGKLTLKVLEKVSKSTKTSSDFKKTVKYLICLCKYWITMYQAIQKIYKASSPGGGEDGDDGEDDDDDDEKPIKKKKSAKKKSKKEDDEEDA